MKKAMRRKGVACGVVVLACAAAPAMGQSLLHQPVPQVPAPEEVPRVLEPAAMLRPYSLIAVVPPPPRQFQKNDIVQVIINETSVQKFEQSLDRKKEYDLSGGVQKFPDLRKLLELQFRTGDTQPSIEVDVRGESEFKGDGKSERKEQFTTRVSARVLEVKPNGTLLLEARKTVQSDKETSTVVVAGLARPEDITKSNTVQSTQLADLVIRVENEGEVRDAAKRGLIPQVLDTIFNF